MADKTKMRVKNEAVLKELRLILSARSGEDVEVYLQTSGKAFDKFVVVRYNRITARGGVGSEDLT